MDADLLPSFCSELTYLQTLQELLQKRLSLSFLMMSDKPLMV